MEKQVKLTSSEKVSITTSEKNVKLSKYLQSKLDGDLLDVSEKEIKLPDIGIEVLKKVVSYFEHFKGEEPKPIEKPLISPIMKEVTDEWSASFIDDIGLDMLVEITIAANILSIKCLAELAYAKIASMCKDKGEKEILDTFGISDLIIDEEIEKKVLAENKWLDEDLA